MYNIDNSSTEFDSEVAKKEAEKSLNDVFLVRLYTKILEIFQNHWLVAMVIMPKQCYDCHQCNIGISKS